MVKMGKNDAPDTGVRQPHQNGAVDQRGACDAPRHVFCVVRITSFTR